MARNLPLIPLLLMFALGNARHAIAAEATNYEVILMVEGKKVSDTWINLSAGGTLIEIPAAPVLSALAPMVNQDVLHRIEASVSNEGTLSNRTLSRFGVSLSINGPKRQVFLSLAKEAPKPKPVIAKAIPDSNASVVSPPPKAKADSGPWATSPTPPLPGNRETALQGPDSSLLIDIGWEESALKNVPQKGPATSNPPVAETPDNAAAKQKPKIEMDVYRLDRTRDELFEDVFKHKPPPLPINVEVTLLVDGKSYGTLWINYSNEMKRYTFPADPVLNALQGLVKKELFDKLASRAKSLSRFTVEDLIECGFPTVLNTSVFELSTGVPAQLLGTKIHPISGQRLDPYTVPAYEPGWISAYANVHVKERLPYYQYNPTPFDSGGRGKQQVEDLNGRPRQPAITNLDGAVNLFSWVVEGKGTLWEKPDLNEFEVSRQDIRLVHDWPRKALRLTAGDLIFPTSGFQGFLKMGGVGFSRDLSLQPHLAAYPVKDFEFFLNSRSEVKIFINGSLKATYQLDQGSHDLSSFPFAAGESDVEIQITDEMGQIQTLNFNFIHEPNLLAVGRSAFSYNVGLPRRDTWRLPGSEDPDQIQVMNYEYDPAHPLAFLQYRRGLTDRLTMEAYTQDLDTAGLIGINALHALPIGKVKAEVAASLNGNSEFGWAGNAEYTYIPKATSAISPSTWRLRVEYLDREFFRPGQDQGLLGSLTYGGYYQNHSALADLSLGASYTLRIDSVDFYSGYLGVGKRIGNAWAMNFSVRNTFDWSRHTNTSVSATISYYLFQGENSINASNRMENHVPDGTETGAVPNWDNYTDVAWDYNGSAPFPKNPSLAATADFSPRSNDYSGRATWKSDQGIMEVNARRYEPKTTSVINNYADLELRTSLVFVDGSFAFSRPINNSFLMVKGIENEKACDILVNPNEMGYDAKSRQWLPGVVPNVIPYTLKKVHLEVQDPPFGSNDERSDFTIYPGYKSGYLLTMGTEATIIALGTLLLGPGVPVEYKAFTATPLDGTKGDPIMGFTNGAGKFQLTRLKPGSYRIDLVDDDGNNYTLIMTLPKHAEGIKALGTLILKRT